VRQLWLDRGALPLRVGEVCAIWPGEEPGQSATLVLDGAPPVRIAQDLATLAMMKIQIALSCACAWTATLRWLWILSTDSYH
jgi:hypothetical protein